MWGAAADEYAHDCRHVSALIERFTERPAATVPDIGCGGGKNVFNLKERFDVTGVDLHPTMLARAGELNPESVFVQGDMRTVRLGTTFDAVLMDDTGEDVCTVFACVKRYGVMPDHSGTGPHAWATGEGETDV